MNKLLYIAHTEADGTISDNSLEALAAAVKIKQDLKLSLSVGVIGSGAVEAANSISNCGADDFYTVSGAAFTVSRYATDAAAVEAMVKKTEPDIVLGFGTVRFMRSVPGAAFRCGGRIDTHISGISTEDELLVKRWYYRQRMEATLKREQRPWFLLLDKGVFEPFQGEKAEENADGLDIEVSDDMQDTAVSGLEMPEGGSQTIKPDAELLFVAGAGWTKKQADGQPDLKEAENIILQTLERSKASLGSSKSLVDLNAEGEQVLKFMSHLNQVGQTGATPRHDKGLATCCHGEEPHVVGWRFIKERRAVNTDANCGWAQGKTDVLYIADAFAVMRKLNELLAT